MLLEPSVGFANAPIIYPANGQTMEQQGADEAQCRGWAQQQTGVSPSSTPPEYYSSGYSSPGVVGGAARGAALGAIGGEIMNDDAGQGAKAGAAMGADWCSCANEVADRVRPAVPSQPEREASGFTT